MGKGTLSFTERLQSRSYLVKSFIRYLAGAAVGIVIYLLYAGSLSLYGFLSFYLPFVVGGAISWLYLRSTAKKY